MRLLLIVTLGLLVAGCQKLPQQLKNEVNVLAPQYGVLGETVARLERMGQQATDVCREGLHQQEMDMTALQDSAKLTAARAGLDTLKQTCREAERLTAQVTSLKENYVRRHTLYNTFQTKVADSEVDEATARAELADHAALHHQLTERAAELEQQLTNMGARHDRTAYRISELTGRYNALLMKLNLRK